MNGFRVATAALTAVVVAGSLAAVANGQQPTALPTTSAPPPVGAEGLAVFPAVEGWGPSADGKSTLIQVGYYNRNKEQVIDIPVGPNNRIEPGGPDMGQPTHFEPGRSYGVFAIAVPKDFGTKKLTWTLTANGQTNSIALWLNPPYWVDFYKKAATGNTPPVVKVSQTGPELSGPPVGTALSLTATVGQALPLSLWVKDAPDTYDPEEGLPADQRRGRQTAQAGRGRGEPPAPNFDITAASARGAGSQRGGAGRFGPQSDASVTWKIHRGTASVKFADPVIRLNFNEKYDAFQEAKTTATFSAPGEYVLRAQVNDRSGDGGGGEQCCWTDALVKVSVK